MGPEGHLLGGKGDDYLNGEAGSDTYVYTSGDGSDTIDDEVGFADQWNVDVLLFNDLNTSDVSLSREGAELKILVTSTGDVITVDDQFYSTVDNLGIEKIKFADGSVMDRDDILAFV
ncbi:calcium-binding protein [Shinella sp.]|uniref:calcium-binding protein n=1 Tax=Shinella sp. TaxID=1870904 RepID=UPI0040350731